MASIKPVLWMLAILIILDVCIGVVTTYPDDPMNDEIGTLQRYFNYGRSVEDKVRWMTSDSNQTASRLANSGWLIREQTRKSKPDPGRSTLASIYGMSFSSHIGHALEKVDPDVSVRLSGGPGATVSRSYADYLLDRGEHEADIIMLGVLASSIETTGTVSHMTWNFEAPSSHFYPKFYVEDDELRRVEPPAYSLDQFREKLKDEQGWASILDFIRTHDPYYDRFSFEKDIFDDSVIGRLVRRAWAQRQYSVVAERFYNTEGFTNYDNSLDVTKSLIQAMHDQARRDNKVFIALLIHTMGYQDHLYAALNEFLDDNGIAYLSTHDIVDPTVFQNFQRDGHFMPELDFDIARELSALIGELDVTERIDSKDPA